VERLRNWTRDELVLTMLFWVCLSMSALFYLLAGADRAVQIKLMEDDSGRVSSDARLSRTSNSTVARPAASTTAGYREVALGGR